MNEEDIVRCKCGAFAKSSAYSGENSQELLSCSCKKCKKSWVEDY